MASKSRVGGADAVLDASNKRRIATASSSVFITGGVLAITPLGIPKCCVFAKYHCPCGSWPGRNGLAPLVNSKRGALPSQDRSRPARKRSGSCHSVTRAAPGAGWRPPLSTTIDQQKELQQRWSSPRRFQPTPQGLTHEPQRTNPEQHNNSSSHWLTPKTDHPHEQQDQREAKGQQDQGKELAEQIQQFRNNAKYSDSLAGHGTDGQQEALGMYGQIYGAREKLFRTGQEPSG